MQYSYVEGSPFWQMRRAIFFVLTFVFSNEIDLCGNNAYNSPI